MTEDDFLETELKKQQEVNPTLRGWSPGDEDCPLPFPEDGLRAEDSWRQPADAHTRLVPYEQQFMEFPLFYGRVGTKPVGARHVVRDRQYRQIRFAGEMTTEGVPLVLMTNDFKVIAAKNIWMLLWAYLKSKISKKPKTRKPKLPQYK